VTTDWDDLRYFLASSRAGTFAEAARALKVSSPTVGRRLKALEQRLRLQLFRKGENRLQLTDHGLAILAVAEEMERTSFELARLAERQSLATEKPVRITAVAPVALFLTRHFDELYASSDQTAIEIVSTGRCLSLARNEAEIALRSSRALGSGNLLCRRIGRIAYALYASKEFIRNRKIRTLEEARRSTLIRYERTPNRRSQSNWLDRFVTESAATLRLNDFHLMREAVFRGAGIGLLPCCVADDEAGLVRLTAPPAELTENTYLLLHPNVRKIPSVRRAADALVELFDSSREKFLGVTTTH